MTLYFFAEAVVEFLFESVCYGIGKILVPVITLGRARTQGDNEDVAFRWHGFARGSDGRIVLSPGVTALCGMVMLILVFVLVVYTAVNRLR